MIKILFLAVLCISAFQVQADCLDFYYGVEQDQPFATGYDYINYYNDNGEYYGGLDYESLINQYDNGTYVVQGTYKISVSLQVFNQYLDCRSVYSRKISTEDYAYERQGFRSPSQIGQNFTQQEVQPNYNITLKSLFQSVVSQYIQESPVVKPYILDILEQFANSVQTNQNSQQY